MRGEVRIGRSIYGVVVINGSLCSRVYGIYIGLVDFYHIYWPSFRVGLVVFILIFGRRFVSEKRWPTATPTIRLPVAVVLGWASHDIIEETIAEPAYIMYGERLPCGTCTCSFLHRLEN